MQQAQESAIALWKYQEESKYPGGFCPHGSIGKKHCGICLGWGEPVSLRPIIAAAARVQEEYNKQAAESQRIAVVKARQGAERELAAIFAVQPPPPRPVGPIGPWSFSARTPVPAAPVPATKDKRKAPPKKIRDKVWKNTFGDALGGKCVCCSAAIDIAHWECAHILASKEGGLDAEDNLLPTCRSCNRSMGTENLWAFKARCYPK